MEILGAWFWFQAEQFNGLHIYDDAKPAHSEEGNIL